ncbi:MAG TPA: hypothetical protein VME18_02145 [Acidobacteriaceae bacterium]|nr:hypothetical protein [Acidobacteriaceae bacterium]
MKRFSLISLSLLLPVLAGMHAHAQTISPIIVEYHEKGAGRILLTNDTLTPLVVILQPESFSIAPDGRAIYRPLDPGIHVELSTTSVRLMPRQQYYVFYKTSADSLPAWYTIYATFSPAHRGPGLTVRIMLPHTVYLLQKEPLRKDDVHAGPATWDARKKLVICDVENISKAYGRMREGSVQAGRESTSIDGFPLLPGEPRHLEIPWSGKNPPELLTLHFDHFELRVPITAGAPAAVASTK